MNVNVSIHREQKTRLYAAIRCLPTLTGKQKTHPKKHHVRLWTRRWLPLLRCLTPPLSFFSLFLSPAQPPLPFSISCRSLTLPPSSVSPCPASPGAPGGRNFPIVRKVDLALVPVFHVEGLAVMLSRDLIGPVAHAASSAGTLQQHHSIFASRACIFASRE